MNYEESDISNKSSLITLFLCLLFGRLGIHRFYVGKYFTGVLYLIIGASSIVFDALGFSYAFVSQAVFLLLIYMDVYAIYSDSFTDAKGNLIISKSKTLVYDSYEERDKIILDEKLDKFILICISIAFYITYLILVNFVF